MEALQSKSSANSPLWKRVDEILEPKLALEFSDRNLAAKSTAELAATFGTRVRDFER